MRSLRRWILCDPHSRTMRHLIVHISIQFKLAIELVVNGRLVSLKMYGWIHDTGRGQSAETR